MNLFNRLGMLFLIVNSLCYAKTTVAILDFKNNGSVDLEYLGAVIPEILSTSMANSEKVTLVERSQIQKIVKELSLGASGLIDVNTAAELGKMSGANKVILGSFVKLGTAIRIDAKVVDVASAEVLQGAATSARAANVETLDRTVELLAQDLLKRFTGEEKEVAVQGDSQKKGELQVAFSDFDISAFMVDGESLQPEQNQARLTKKLSHGEHLIQVYKGIWSPKIIWEGKVKIPGGYSVKAKWGKGLFSIYETALLESKTDTEEVRDKQQKSPKKHQKWDPEPVVSPQEKNRFSSRAQSSSAMSSTAILSSSSTKISSQSAKLDTLKKVRDCGTEQDLGCEMMRGNKLPVDADFFKGAILSLKNQRSEYARATSCSALFMNQIITAKQFGILLSLFERSDVDKMKVVKALAPNIVDPSRATGFAVQLRGSYDQEQYLKILQKAIK